MNVALLTVFSRVFLGYSSSLLPWQSHLSSRLVAVSPLLSSQSASVSCHLQNFSLFLKRGCKRTWSVVPVKILSSGGHKSGVAHGLQSQPFSAIAYFHLDNIGLYPYFKSILLNTLTKSLWLWKIPCSQILGFRV